jgi:hypothetical protein
MVPSRPKAQIDLAHPLEVAGRRREAAAGVLHRLQEDRGHRLGTLEEDLLLDLVGGPAAERHRVVAVQRRPVDVGVGHLVRAGHQRLERRLERGQPGDGQRALRRAVVGHRPGDHLVLARVAGQFVVLLGQLPGRLDRLAAACGEEHLVQVARRIVRQPLRQLHRLGVRVAPHREERQLLGLLVGGLGQLVPPVPGVDHEQAGQPVHVPLPAVVVDVRALAAHNGGHRGVLVRRHAGEVHPQVVVRSPRQICAVTVHGYLVPQV